MIAAPFVLLVLGVLWSGLGDAGEGRWTHAGRCGLLALALGALGPMNTWDLPTCAVLTGLALAGRGAHRAGPRGFARGLFTAAAVIGAAVLLYLPFYRHFQGPGLAVGRVSAEGRSPLGAFMTIWGTQAYLAATFLALALWSARAPFGRAAHVMQRFGTARTLRRMWYLCRSSLLRGAAALVALAAGLVGALAQGASGEMVLPWLTLGLGAAVAALALARSTAEAGQRALLATGIGVILGTELWYLRDFLAGSDWYRMNTVFKFQMQAWVLLGVALGSALPSMWAAVVRRLRALRVLWAAGTALLVSAGLSYAVWAVPQRVAERFPGTPAGAGTLDGTAFMADAVYYWPDGDSPIEMKWQLDALRWIWQNVSGTPVLAQADLGYYREGGLLLTSFSGLPTIVGMHAAEQRPASAVANRQRDVYLLYSTEDVRVAEEIMARYSVRLILVGPLEREIYPAEGLAKFAALAATGDLERAYANEALTIYRVPE